MRKILSLLSFLIFTVFSFAQNSNQKYDVFIRKADSLYRAKDYKNSALAFSDAFNIPDSKITMNHRYNAACSYALANCPDSAFANLNYVATLMNYSRYSQIKSDPDLKSLYTDSRWNDIVELVKNNREKEYSKLDFVTLNGSKVEVYIAGIQNNKTNKPVIVFENGMADTYDRWKAIIDEISKTNAVFAYNRPRIGESEDDNLSPTTEHIVSNLRKMLLEKELKPPYLLVSHSFGGAYIRAFVSQHPNEIAGLIFMDPVDFTKTAGMGDLPYLEMGFTKHQIDSAFGKPNKNFLEKLYTEMPKHYVEEVKISVQLTQTEFNECNRNPLPDVPVHFIMAGGYTASGGDNSPLICDREKLFRVSENLKMKRYLQLLYPLKYGKLFYCSKSSHFVQTDEPDLVLSCIKLALTDFEKIQRENKVSH
ncbi:MAG: alpha/beta fold hydrolase [Macellibacteroides fermentans]|uniref:alpha/beta fold hydrolase n=1 Tax=Macellibacteroides fermentans TaxID=879969 RepID=UPI003AC9C674